MIGDFAPGATIPILFNTHKSDGTPIALAGSPSVVVYADSTTESNAGVSLVTNFDGVVGLHQVFINTAADTNFYAANRDFNVVLSAGTVDGVSVAGSVIESFSLSNRVAKSPIDNWSATTRTLTSAAPPTSGDIATAVWAAGSRTLSTAPPTSGDIATAVWASSTRTLTSAAPPTSGDIATAVWAAGSRTLSTAPPTSGDIASSVWSATTRTLTSASAPTTSEVATAVWAAGSRSLSVSPPTSSEITTSVWAAGARTLTSASAPTTSEIATAVAALAIEGSLDLVKVLRIILAADAGRASGLDTTTASFKSLDGSKNRIIATVDEHGNRSAITLDAS